MENILTDNSKAHYDEKYFDWQKNIGAFGGLANKTKFEKYIGASDRVIDFGCGGGFLLHNIQCQEKLGIEINPSARTQCLKNGIKAVASAEEVPDQWADVIISNNALEHTETPLAEIKKLFNKLKPGGRIVFVVPCDNITYEYDAKNIHKHLYSWSPMNLGNLFQAAGYEVESVEPYIHKWMRNYTSFYKTFGPSLFHLACRIYGRIDRKWYQVRIVARRPASA